MRVTRQTKKPVEKQVNKKSKRNPKKNPKKKNSKPSTNDLLEICRPLKVVLVKDVYINSATEIKRETRAKSGTSKVNSKKELEKPKKTVSKPPSLQRIIDDTFESITKKFAESKKELNIGDIVLGRMRGYTPWAARICSFTKDKKSAGCYFYGSHNNGPVNTSKMVPFKDGFEVIRLIAIRDPYDFVKGIKEVELEIGIPDDRSCIKEQASIK